MVLGPSVFHVPVRSEHQILLKAVQGLHAYAKRGGVQDPRHGSHWRHIFNAYVRGELTDDLLRGFAASYGEFDDGIVGASSEDLQTRGFTLGTMDVALTELPSSTIEPNNADTAIGLAGEVVQSAPVAERPLRRLVVDGNTVKRADDDRGVTFLALPPREPEPRPSPLDESRPLLIDFLQPHIWPMGNFVPSAWNGHIPLMFCLVRAIQPRRFVELGTHFGASFLAACQAVERLGLETECIAVDTWQGDEHAGFYGEDVYQRFRRELDKHEYSFAAHLRTLFADAAVEFEARSVDLLHIDGLHTYEAVRDDYETWLPKLTDDAVVLFHDTNVFERDFGVWQLFRELSAHHLTFNFLHSHGLGILVREGAEDLPIGRLVKRLVSSPTDSAFAQLVLETAGARATADAHLRMIQNDLGEDPYAMVRRAMSAEGDLARTRLELERVRRAESDLRWFIRRLDRSPFGFAFRRYEGFRTLKRRWPAD